MYFKSYKFQGIKNQQGYTQIKIPIYLLINSIRQKDNDVIVLYVEIAIAHKILVPRKVSLMYVI